MSVFKITMYTPEDCNHLNAKMMSTSSKQRNKLVTTCLIHVEQEHAARVLEKVEREQSTNLINVF